MALTLDNRGVDEYGEIAHLLIGVVVAALDIANEVILLADEVVDLALELAYSELHVLFHRGKFVREIIRGYTRVALLATREELS